MAFFVIIVACHHDAIALACVGEGFGVAAVCVVANAYAGLGLANQGPVGFAGLGDDFSVDAAMDDVAFAVGFKTIVALALGYASSSIDADFIGVAALRGFFAILA